MIHLYNDTSPLLRQAGLSRLEDALGKAGVYAEKLARNAGQEQGCMLQESGVEAASANPTPGTVVYVVDCGGTKTTISQRIVGATSDDVSWSIVKSGRNAEFDVGDSATRPINRYLHNCFAQIKSANAGSNEVSLALTWSNGLKVAPAPVGVAGVGALVDGVGAGSYRKGEPFTKGLYDGFDLGAAVAEAAAAHGLNLKTLVIANDTIYTANAHPGCDAGVICSTGANGTIIIPDSQGRRMLFNAESGGKFFVASEWLADCERDWARAHGRDVCIEDLSAGLESATTGLGVGRLLSLHAKHLAGQRGLMKVLAPVEKVIDDNGLGVFDGRAVTLLANGEFKAFKAIKECFSQFDQAQLNVLQSIAANLERRAGLAAALLSYVSIARNVSSTPRAFTVALDSRIADGSAIFRAALEEGLQQLLQGNAVTVQYKKTQGGITVPTQGGASSLDQVMQRHASRLAIESPTLSAAIAPSPESGAVPPNSSADKAQGKESQA